jgi:hypothetical protein
MVRAAPPFQFTSVVQPTSTVSATPPAEPFDAGIAYLMGQCCTLTYNQFDAGTITTADFASLDLAGSLAGYTAAASNLTPFTISEAVEPGPTAGDVGDYVTVQGGFGVLLTLTQAGQQTRELTVIALRGTRSFAEWLDDAEFMPVPFAGAISQLKSGLGSVHAGFYADYTVGTDGLTAATGQELSSDVSLRAKGSLAAQVGTYVSSIKGADVYVTGHSLGGAVATLCALDVAYTFPGSAESLALYALASPRVAVGLSDSFNVAVPTLGNMDVFLANFQRLVPNAYQVIHAADIVPIVPPTSITVGPLTLNAARVTDPWQVGSGATATASVSGGAVTSVTVNNDNSSGYTDLALPTVVFTGGGGSGAAATASIGFTGDVDVKVTSGGSGYTSPPTVTIVSGSPGAPGNVVSFIAQTGDIGNNHGCIGTYVPYLQALAGGFS